MVLRPAVQFVCENRLSLSRPEMVAKLRGVPLLAGLASEGLREPDQITLLTRATGGDVSRIGPVVCTENPNTGVAVVKSAQDGVSPDDTGSLNRTRNASLFKDRCVRTLFNIVGLRAVQVA